MSCGSYGSGDDDDDDDEEAQVSAAFPSDSSPSNTSVCSKIVALARLISTMLDLKPHTTWLPSLIRQL